MLNVSYVDHLLGRHVCFASVSLHVLRYKMINNVSLH